MFCLLLPLGQFTLPTEPRVMFHPIYSQPLPPATCMYVISDPVLDNSRTFPWRARTNNLRFLFCYSLHIYHSQLMSVAIVWGMYFLQRTQSLHGMLSHWLWSQTWKSIFLFYFPGGFWPCSLRNWLDIFYYFYLDPLGDEGGN